MLPCKKIRAQKDLSPRCESGIRDYLTITLFYPEHNLPLIEVVSTHPEVRATRLRRRHANVVQHLILPDVSLFFLKVENAR